MLALDFEYAGRGARRLESHADTLSLAQKTAHGIIIGHVDGLLEQPLVRRPRIDWSARLAKLRVDYTGEEQGEALPTRLAEPIPGLPDPEQAAQLRAEEFVDDHILELPLDPGRVARPNEEWPEEPRRARVNCERVERWYEIAEHLLQLGILGVVETRDIFTARGQMVLNGLFARKERASRSRGRGAVRA